MNKNIVLCNCGCGREVKHPHQHFIKGHKINACPESVNDLLPCECAFCHKPIFVHRWRINRFGINNVFCSREHQKMHRSALAMKSFVCENCGKQFTIKGSIKKGKHIYCCQKCAVEHRVNLPHKTIQVQCSGCGKQLTVYPSKAKINKKFYCSVNCRAKSITGINNPAFTSGMGRKREYASNWKSQRRAAIIRDGGKCRVCGKIPKISRYLHVHHIIPAYTFNGDFEQANKLTNLITLCLTCHKKVESGHIPIQPNIL